MKNSLKTIGALVGVVLLSVLVSWETQDLQSASQRLLAYTTTSTRTNNVGTLCGANLDRTTLVNQDDLSAATGFRASVNDELGIDGYSFP
jgi:hypothetical protein